MNNNSWHKKEKPLLGLLGSGGGASAGGVGPISATGGTTPAEASGAASSYTITSINITRFAATGTPNSDYLVLVSVNNYA